MAKRALLNPKLFSADVERIPTRDGYGQAIVELGKRNTKVVVLCADLAESTRSSAFAQAYPERYFEVGVAEQNMAGIAAGLALSGYIPFISSYAVFSPGRNWDQLRVSVCYSQANVKIIGAHAGLSVGPDGATHQALEDIAITRVLPNLTIIAPCDDLETRRAVLAAAAHIGPVYIRFAREKTPRITTATTPFVIGKAQVLVEGNDVALIAAGPILAEALYAAKMLLHRKVRASVIDAATIKPLDEALIHTVAKRTKAIVTIEEHQRVGGLGGAVAEALARTRPTVQEFVAMPDSFGQSGEPDELLRAYRLNAPAIVRAALRAIKRKRA